MKKFLSLFLTMAMIVTSFIAAPTTANANEIIENWSYNDWRSINFNLTVTDYLNNTYSRGEGFTNFSKGFKFTVPKSGKVTIKLKNYTPSNISCEIIPISNNKNLDGSLYKDFCYNNILGYIDNQTATFDLMKGTYGLLCSDKYGLYDFSSNNNYQYQKFSLTLSFKETKESFPESIDTYESTVFAGDYSKISTNKTYYGQFAHLSDYSSPTDIDYYSVSLNKGKMWVTYNSSDCGAHIALFNAKSQSINLIYDDKHDVCYYNIPSKGTYYIQLKGNTIYDDRGYAVKPYGAYSFSVTQKNPFPTIKKVTLNKTSFVYNGKTQKPTITVYDSNGDKVNPKYYTVKYNGGNSKSINHYWVTVTFKGKYKAKSYTINGEKWADGYSTDYIIKPKSTTISKLCKKKNNLTVKWKKQSSITGYQIQYSTDKNFKKNKKTITVSKAKTTSKTISKLKKKKTYYVRVRTYKSLGKKSAKIYSSWSTSKKIKM